jgi:hypothetical protein
MKTTEEKLEETRKQITLDMIEMFVSMGRVPPTEDIEKYANDITKITHDFGVKHGLEL